MIGIVDYGMGNLFSVRKALERLGHASRLVSCPEDFAGLDGLILPGVGAFGKAMERLAGTGLEEGVRRFAAQGKPLLGICLGMQLLFTESEEHGLHKGLDLLPGRVVRLEGTCKIPHMGWNKLQFLRPSPLFEGVEEDYVYFVHSYKAVPAEKEDLLAVTDYFQEVPAVVGRGNILGMQFHPEKSGPAGMRLLDNFARMVRRPAGRGRAIP